MGKNQPENGKAGKRYRIELSGVSAFLWGTGLFVLLAWIFVLGVFAGRGLIPGEVAALGELKAQMAKLQQMISRRDRTELEEIKKLQRDAKFAFFDELSVKKEESQKPAAKPVAKPAGKPEEKPAPSKPPDKESAKPSSGEVTYVVQIASLETEAKAKDMVNRLTRKGFPAYFYKVVVKDKAYFRVQCGIFKTEAEAVKINKRLAEKEKLTGLVHKSEGN